MDFDLSTEQEMIRKEIRKFAEKAHRMLKTDGSFGVSCAWALILRVFREAVWLRTVMNINTSVKNNTILFFR